MVFAAYELLRTNPNPSPEDIRHGLEGNMCRCTGYQNIVRAVQAAVADPRGAGLGGAR
jgi:carbon-monoxide dehydrogenase small subunit